MYGCKGVTWELVHHGNSISGRLEIGMVELLPGEVPHIVTNYYPTIRPVPLGTNRLYDYNTGKYADPSAWKIPLQFMVGDRLIAHNKDGREVSYQVIA